MYRHFIVKIPTIYCPTWPCDRKCGLLHLPLLKLRGLGEKKTTTKSGESTDSGRPSTTNGDFEEIMTRAGQKVSVSYVEPPMPPPLLIPEGRGEGEGLSPHVDTTILFFDQGIETTRTDEEATLFGDPPTTLDSESTIDEMLSRSSQDLAMNPIFHDRIDSRIDSDDEFDYSRLDHMPPRLEHRNSHDSLADDSIVSISSQISRAKQWRRAHYEPSLDTF